MKKRFPLLTVFLTFIFIFSAIPLWAADASLPSKPSSNIYVQDYAGMLSVETKQNILNVAGTLDEKTTAQIAVVTVNSLEDQPVEDYANALFRAWGIGNKEKNNGILFLISKEDRKFRIEIGYGLEGRINDAKAGRFLDEAIPYFKKGDYDQGVDIVFNHLVAEVCAEYNIDNLGTAVADTSKDSGNSGFSDFSWIGAIIVFIILGALFGGGGRGGRGGRGRTGGPGHWGGPFGGFGGFGGLGGGGGFGGGSSGGGGFGGGSSGGGGSSRGW